MKHFEVAEDDPRIDGYRNRWWWNGYDARYRGEPFAILTTTQDWRGGWSAADFEIERRAKDKNEGGLSGVASGV